MSTYETREIDKSRAYNYKGSHSRISREYSQQSQELQLTQLGQIIEDGGVVYDEIEFADVVFGRTSGNDNSRQELKKALDRFKDAKGQIASMPASDSEGFMLPRFIGELETGFPGEYGCLTFDIENPRKKVIRGVISLALSKAVHFAGDVTSTATREKMPFLTIDYYVDGPRTQTGDSSGIVNIGVNELFRSHAFGVHPHQDTVFLDRVAQARDELGEF